MELVDHWSWIDNTDQAYRILEGKGSAVEQASSLPLIEKNDKPKANYPRGFFSANSQRTASCELLVDKPEHIAISVNAPTPSMLILRDQFYPGWKASLDSISVPIYRANGFTRAVSVPLGAHAIEFNYKPDSMKYGAIIALCALAVLFLLAFMAIGPGLWRFVKWTAGQK